MFLGLRIRSKVNWVQNNTQIDEHSILSHIYRDIINMDASFYSILPSKVRISLFRFLNRQRTITSFGGICSNVVASTMETYVYQSSNLNKALSIINFVKIFLKFCYINSE